APAVTSKDLDLTLIVLLLRNLPPVVAAPKSGFDELPSANDISDGANIATLKYYKHEIVSHSNYGTLSDNDFSSIWYTLEKAITGLDNSKATAASIQDAKTKRLDNTMVNLWTNQNLIDTNVQVLDKISMHIEKDEIEKIELKEMIKHLHMKLELDRDFQRMIMEDTLECCTRMNMKQEKIYERVEKCLEVSLNLQQRLAPQTNILETIAKERKQKRENLIIDPQSRSSEIQDDISILKEGKKVLATKVQRDVESLTMRSGINLYFQRYT
ncbi:Hypothetical predicted protein, partial [Mytilus galloprovincialis]